MRKTTDTSRDRDKDHLDLRSYALLIMASLHTKKKEDEEDVGWWSGGNERTGGFKERKREGLIGAESSADRALGGRVVARHSW